MSGAGALSLVEWRRQMAEAFAGRFYENADGAIRHDTRKDVDGAACRPIIAFAFVPGEEFTDMSNRCADLLGIAVGLDPENVNAIMDAADDLAGNASSAELRRWMKAVLVHGKVYEA